MSGVPRAGYYKLHVTVDSWSELIKAPECTTTSAGGANNIGDHDKVHPTFHLE